MRLDVKESLYNRKLTIYSLQLQKSEAYESQLYMFRIRVLYVFGDGIGKFVDI